MKQTILTILSVFGCLFLQAQTNDLPRTSPEAVGLRSAQVSAFFDSLLAMPQTEIHSVIVMRSGKIVGELYPVPFRPEYKHTQFSCSKTFVAAAVGIAIGEKKLQLTDRLVTFFPEHLPKLVSWRLASITVEDLLTMRSGFTVDTQMRNVSRQWIRDYLAHPMNADPGKRFQYDSIDTYLLSAIVQRVTGMNVLDYLRQRVFKALNITDVCWELSPEGIVTGGWGLYIQPESLAKFGQLLLQRGRWHGEQLIPAEWVDAMMREHVSRKNGDGYCYQMWRCGYPTASRADGAYGQYVVVVPRQNAVIVINQCHLAGGGRQFGYIWKTLFKGMHAQPLPPSDDYRLLLQRADSLPVLMGEPTHQLMGDYQGLTIRLGKNPLKWTALRFESGDVLMITDNHHVTARVLMGYQQWATSAVSIYPLNARYAVQNQFSTIRPPFHVGACYAWQGDTLQAKLHFVDWMGAVRLNMRFDADTVAITAQENYQKKPITIRGIVERPQETIITKTN